MKAHKRLLTIVAAATIGLVVATGCAQYATGAGVIPSANRESTDRLDKALFAFSFDGPKKKLSGRYYDHGTGDHLKFEGIDSYVDDPGTNDNCLAAYGRYESRTKDKPGEGTFRLIACDGGAPGGYTGDTISVYVMTGPLAGYTNAGQLLHGNIKTHSRPQPVPAF
ncbi:MAG TPA: hypothetical protein VGM69_21265 [Chloroflexota bacterium]|jgi:hypothetical protein